MLGRGQEIVYYAGMPHSCCELAPPTGKIINYQGRCNQLLAADKNHMVPKSINEIRLAAAAAAAAAFEGVESCEHAQKEQEMVDE